MDILVTGANGFIGKHLCKFLENSHNVFRVVRQNNDNSANTFEADLTDEKSVEELSQSLKGQKIDIVIHLASKLANADQNEDEQIRILLDNIAITKNMVSLIKEIKPQKLINFSSMAVYPNIDGIFNEESQIKMSGNAECMYGLSKFCSENIFDFLLKNENLIISHLRVAQVYGEGARQDRIMSIMKQELEEKNTITVFGNGERQSNFINVNKLMNFVNYFIENDIHGIYNVGDESLSYLQLAEKIIQSEDMSNVEIIKKTEGSKPLFQLDISKFKDIVLSFYQKEVRK